MAVVLNRKTLEPSLIDVSLTGRVVVGVITHRMRDGDPAQEFAHLAVAIGPEHQMPMVGHQNVTVQFDVAALPTFREDAFEGFKVGVFAKDAQAGIAAIENVVNAAGLVGANDAWHAGSLSDVTQQINET